jgi:hypothetical protein
MSAHSKNGAPLRRKETVINEHQPSRGLASCETDLCEVLRSQIDGNASLIRLSVDLVGQARRCGLNDTEAGCLLIALGCELLNDQPLKAVLSLVTSATDLLARRKHGAT